MLMPMGFIKQFAKNYAIGVMILLALLLIYGPGLRGGFFFDDSANIIESSGVQITSVSFEALRGVWHSGIAGPLGRPVSMLSFAANYYLAGYAPYWFKLSNLLIHCTNAVLVFCLILLLLRDAGHSLNEALRIRQKAAAITALWAFHPIQLTSVLYVVQRMTSLSSMFVLLALILHVWGRQQNRLNKKVVTSFAFAWGVCFPLGMLSKETAVLFFLYVAAYEGVLHRIAIGKLDCFARRYLAFLLLLSLGFVFYLVLTPEAGLFQAYKTRGFTFIERVLTEPRVIWEYIKMITIPTLSDFGLYHDDFVVSHGLLDPAETFFAIGGLLALLVFSWLARNKLPFVAFGILWFMAGHGLESTIFPLELMHEHRNYLPSLGILLAIVSFFSSKKTVEPACKLLAVGGLCGFFVYFSMLTYMRADMYGSDFRRTQIEAGYRARSVRSHYEAGAVMVNMHNQNRSPLLAGLAEKHFEQVNSLDPDYKLALIGMLQLDCLSGASVRNDVHEALKGRIEKGKWTPTDRTAMHGIAEMSNEGTLCLSREQVDDLFIAALGNKSATREDRSVVASDYALYLWLGQKDYIAARDVMVMAISGNEHDVLNRINLLQLLRFLGDRDGLLKLIVDLQKKSLGSKDQAMLKTAINELAAENIFGNK